MKVCYVICFLPPAGGSTPLAIGVSMRQRGTGRSGVPGAAQASLGAFAVLATQA